MMPGWLSILFLLGFGSGILAVAYNGWRSGELPAGSRGWRSYRPNRDDNPIAFHLFLALYVCGGIALCVWGLLELGGMAPPLRWR
ncbi:MAG: hypothetical protein JSS33_00765 [Proteobacteria bacterium]|nr:hypothetical protein [Pseudomonadota bacterium]